MRYNFPGRILYTPESQQWAYPINKNGAISRGGEGRGQIVKYFQGANNSRCVTGSPAELGKLVE